MEFTLLGLETNIYRVSSLCPLVLSLMSSSLNSPISAYMHYILLDLLVSDIVPSGWTCKPHLRPIGSRRLLSKLCWVARAVRRAGSPSAVFATMDKLISII